MRNTASLLPVTDLNVGHALAYSTPWGNSETTRDAERAEFFNTVCRANASPVYYHAFERWQKLWDAQKQTTLVLKAILGGPLAVGLGNPSVTETGLTLHHTYSVPIIPGSAIKGVCKRAIVHLSDEENSLAGKLFGSTTDAGHAIFHDAWLVPKSDKSLLTRDTITPHHPHYYQNEGDKKTWPTDFDDPVPIPFLSVEPGNEFLFVIQIPAGNEKWVEFIERVLHHALTEMGIGAKTTAGYGWFQPWSLPLLWESVELQRHDDRVKTGKWYVLASKDGQTVKITQGEWGHLPGKPAVPKQKQKFTANIHLEKEADGNLTVIDVRRV
jgi:CRISPR type III-B/RAMP module RAMP protein Cmr6